VKNGVTRTSNKNPKIFVWNGISRWYVCACQYITYTETRYSIHMKTANLTASFSI